MMSQCSNLGDDDVYIPRQDFQEGSGDNEEELLGANVDATDFLQPFNNLTNSQSSGLGSLGKRKRKRSEGYSRQSRQRRPTSGVLADPVSRIADVAEDKAAYLAKDDETSIKAVIRQILRIKEITSDPDFKRRCLRASSCYIFRQWFVALLEDRATLMRWCREVVYNPPNWLKDAFRGNADHSRWTFREREEYYSRWAFGEREKDYSRWAFGKREEDYSRWAFG